MAKWHAQEVRSSSVERNEARNRDGVQPRAGVPLGAPARDEAPERPDAAAGCEFVDDRIRLVE